MNAMTTSQNLEQVTELATRYIEDHLDGLPLQWGEVLEHLKARGHGELATAAITAAVLDLERTGAVFYALEGIRRPQPGDAEPAVFQEVAAAVLSLEWPCTRNNRPGGSRSIHEAFEELGGAYRHCDVYDSMHELLKGHELKSGRVYWQRTDVPSRFDAAGQFASRAAAVAHLPEEAPARRQVEFDLVTAYVATLPHRYMREHPIDSGRADVFEPTVRRIVEAKAAADLVTVAHAWAQAAAYRYAANAATDRSVVDTIGVLLPVAPIGSARQFLEHVGADCLELELIYPDGDGFRRELLT